MLDDRERRLRATLESQGWSSLTKSTQSKGSCFSLMHQFSFFSFLVFWGLLRFSFSRVSSIFLFTKVRHHRQRLLFVDLRAAFRDDNKLQKGKCLTLSNGEGRKDREFVFEV